MLDLNADIVSGNSTCDENEVTVVEKTSEASIGQTDDSGTSNSLVVNADEAPTNYGGDADSDYTIVKPLYDISAFNFDILKKGETAVRGGSDKNLVSDSVTKQLFPVNQDGVCGDSELGKGWFVDSSSHTQWLNLSFSENGERRELGVFEQKKQQVVKKSRRGPRSRSSQYRGVTFYRRTGRWESHIWYVALFKEISISRVQTFSNFLSAGRFLLFHHLMLLFSLNVCRDCGKQVYLGKQMIYMGDRFYWVGNYMYVIFTLPIVWIF